MNMGIGAMLAYLGGNEETVKAHQSAMNKTISALRLDTEDILHIGFSDGSELSARDDGQSCCEHRYMVTDDALEHYIGATFTGAELRDAPNEPDDYGDHEVQFLLINTSAGPITFASHNEHNGYYGGFAIKLSYMAAA